MLIDGSGRPTGIADPGYRRWRRPLKLLLPIASPAFQRSLDGFDHRFPNKAGIAKTNFAFRGMNIHVNRRRIEIEKQEGHRKLALHERGVISLPKRRCEHRTFDGASVHEDQLLRAALPAHAGLANQPADPDFRRALGFFHGEKALHEILAVKVADAFDEARRGRQLKNYPLVPDKGERDLRVPGRLKMKLMLDVAALGVFRAEEFPARGQIVEKRPHFYLRSGRFAAIPHRLDPASRHDDLRPRDRVRLARGQAETRHTGDARQSFPSKAEGGDGSEVRRCADLAGGMTLEGKK